MTSIVILTSSQKTWDLSFPMYPLKIQWKVMWLRKVPSHKWVEEVRCSSTDFSPRKKSQAWSMRFSVPKSASILKSSRESTRRLPLRCSSQSSFCSRIRFLAPKISTDTRRTLRNILAKRNRRTGKLQQKANKEKWPWLPVPRWWVRWAPSGLSKKTWTSSHLPKTNCSSMRWTSRQTKINRKVLPKNLKKSILLNCQSKDSVAQKSRPYLRKSARHNLH